MERELALPPTPGQNVWLLCGSVASQAAKETWPSVLSLHGHTARRKTSPGPPGTPMARGPFKGRLRAVNQETSSADHRHAGSPQRPTERLTNRMPCEQPNGPYMAHFLQSGFRGQGKGRTGFVPGCSKQFELPGNRFQIPESPPEQEIRRSLNWGAQSVAPGQNPRFC
ncbi:hypothetical protein DPEC_G00173300 [Dallia pectoralis]|uniref:Uncharacterized protein n=1 Tax=Dallia pectoralis TaxID=75939 RepID=A0ACC2GDW9_DALPE|nr:hypothetical protein DPEC_G00173300 [Dallia pectoralis]